MHGHERHYATIGAVYRMGRDCPGRVGHCWAKDRLREGDLLLCVGHSGDCFADYYLIEEETHYPDIKKLRRSVNQRIGAYDFGTIVYKLDHDRYHLLAGGAVVDAPEAEKTK